MVSDVSPSPIRSASNAHKGQKQDFPKIRTKAKWKSRRLATKIFTKLIHFPIDLHNFALLPEPFFSTTQIWEIDLTLKSYQPSKLKYL